MNTFGIGLPLLALRTLNVRLWKDRNTRTKFFAAYLDGVGQFAVLSEAVGFQIVHEMERMNFYVPDVAQNVQTLPWVGCNNPERHLLGLAEIVDRKLGMLFAVSVAVKP